jgi:O-antigen/teichoic acid export membrane protein
MQWAQRHARRAGRWFVSRDGITASVSLVFLLAILQRVLQVGRVVVFARLLGPEQYGIYTLGMFVVPLVATVASLGMQSAYPRYVSRYAAESTLRWFLKKTLSLTLAVALAAVVVMLLRPAFFSGLLYGDRSYWATMVVAAASVPAYLLIRNLSTIFMGLKLFRAGSFPEFTQAVAYAAGGIPLAWVLRSATAGLVGFALATYISVAVFGLLLARYLRRIEPAPVLGDRPGFYRHLLGFSLWFVVTPVLGHVFHYIDRLSLQHLRGAFDQGVYSAGVNIAETISAFGLAICNVIYPHIAATWEAGDRDKAIRNLDLAIRVTSVAMLLVGLVLVLFGRWLILLLLGDKYGPGATVLPMLVVYYLFTVLVWLYGTYPALIEKTYIAAIGLAFALPANILLNRWLIPRTGMVGAALATMLAYLVMWIIVAGICHRYGLRLAKKTVAACLASLVLLIPAVLGPLAGRIHAPRSSAWLVGLLPDLVTILAVGAVVYVCTRRTWILSASERQIAYAEIGRVVARIRGLVPGRG